MALVDFGQRRGANFLHPRGQRCLPWFGLRFRHIAGALATETARECAVVYLRSVASAGCLNYDEALITVIVDTPPDKKQAMHQYFTASTLNNHRAVGRLQKPPEVPDLGSIPHLEDDRVTSAPIDKGKSKTSDHRGCDVQEHLVDPTLSGHQSWSGIFHHDGRPIQRRSDYDIMLDAIGLDDPDSQIIEPLPSLVPLRY
jgi:hypothetical protein